MARNKYVRDYRLVEYISETGRVKTEYEYIGAHYYYTAPRETVARARIAVLAALAVGWLAFVGALIPVSAAMHTYYISFPFLFAALPLGILTDLCLSTLFLKEPLEHRHADKLQNRYPPACLAAAILSGAALMAELISLLIRGSASPGGDAVFCVCACCISAAAIFVFAKRGSFAAEADKPT